MNNWSFSDLAVQNYPEEQNSRQFSGPPISAESTVLGIDLGTTSVKVAVIEARTRQLVNEWSQTHNAGIPDLPPGHNEQSPLEIWHCLDTLIHEKVDPDILDTVTSIGIAGQMHGIMLWSKVSGEPLTNLITWMDARVTQECLKLMKPWKHGNLNQGYGLVTLQWLLKEKKVELNDGTLFGTVMDYVAWKLCQHSERQPSVTMSIQNAASWGYFNPENPDQWDIELDGVNLPEIVQPNAIIGQLPHVWRGVPAGASIMVPWGDFQACVRAALPIENDQNVPMLNFGTSAQLSYRIHSKSITRLDEDEDEDVGGGGGGVIQYFPYTENEWVRVAASMNGGNVLDYFVKILHSWSNQLLSSATLGGKGQQLETESISMAEVWAKFDGLIASAKSKPPANPDKASDVPSINPLVYPERHGGNPYGTGAAAAAARPLDAGASITGITADSLPFLSDLGLMGREIVRQTLANLLRILPIHKEPPASADGNEMNQWAPGQLILIGQAAQKYSGIVQELLPASFKLIPCSSSAAYGVACAASDSCCQNTGQQIFEL